MDPQKLIDSASRFGSLEHELIREFSQKKDLLAAEINRSMLERPDTNQLIGENNTEMMKDNHANHLRFMESMFIGYDPEIFVDTILWVFRAYRAKGFSTTYWAAQMNAWIRIFKKHLSEECYSAVLPFYEWMQVNIPAFTRISSGQLKDIPHKY